MLLSLIAFMSVDDRSRTFLSWQRTTLCLVNTNRKLFVKTAEPINQLRSVKISLCVEVNICAQERWGDRCSMSLPVYFLIPQDESVWASTPSLLSHASICLLLSLCAWLCLARFWWHLHSSLSAFLSVSFHAHFVALRCFTCLSLFVSSFLFLFLLLHSPVSPSGLLCLLLVSFSSSGGWRRVSPLWLPRGCCGNNSCHFVVKKLTETNEKGKKMQHSKNMQNINCSKPHSWSLSLSFL